MVDDRTEMLIRRNRALRAQAAKVREEARETAALAAEHIAMIRQSQLVLACALSRLRQLRADSGPSADVGTDAAMFCC
jgi:hypothetical protein